MSVGSKAHKEGKQTQLDPSYGDYGDPNAPIYIFAYFTT